MFDFVRQRQRLFLALILLLILPAFVLFGVQGYQKYLEGGDNVATVDGDDISRQQFDFAQRRQLDNLREMFGGQIDPALLDTQGARREVLEGLIAQRVLLNKAVKDHLTVSDEQLRDAILAVPGLRKPDGSFDRDNYRLMLSGQGLNDATFEAQMRRDLAIQSLPQSIVQSAMVPGAVVDRLVAMQGETRVVRDRVLKTDDYAAKATVDPAQVKKFYDDNAQLFEIPETLKVQYVVLDPLALAPQVQVDDAKVRAFYEQNKSRYSTPEQRQASHVLLTVATDATQAQRDAARKQAEDVLAQLKGGADFAALAKSRSQDPGTAAKGGDLGLFTPEMMVKPVADAAFALKVGQISDVVSTEFGYHIIKLTKIEPGTTKTFDQVRPEIEAEYRRQQAAELFSKDSEPFTNLVYEQPDSLQPAAERFKLKLETLDNVGRSGLDGGAPNAPLSNPKVLAALFSDDSLKNKRNTQAIQIGSQALVSARVLEHHDAQRKPLADVEADIRKRLVAQQAHTLAVQAGEALLKEAQGGAALADLGPEKTLARTEDKSVSRAAIGPIFKVPADKLPSVVGVDLGAAGYGLFQVLRVTQPDAAAVTAQRAPVSDQFAKAESQSQLTDFIEALKAKAKIERNVAALKPAAAGEP